MYMCTCVGERVYICVSNNNKGSYICTCICTRLFVHLRACVCMNACMLARVCVCVCVSSVFAFAVALMVVLRYAHVRPYVHPCMHGHTSKERQWLRA